MSTSLTPDERFEQYASRPDDCWLWTGYCGPRGYGVFSVNGKAVRAHRYSWSRVNGPIPDGMCICHRCDNPRCVRPDHLFLGTNDDNVADRDRKGRQARGSTHGWALHPDRIARGERHGSHRHPERRARGERVGTAKLTMVLVRELRARAASGENGPSLARAFGLDKSTVYEIIKGETWRE